MGNVFMPAAILMREGSCKIACRSTALSDTNLQRRHEDSEEIQETYTGLGADRIGLLT